MKQEEQRRSLNAAQEIKLQQQGPATRTGELGRAMAMGGAPTQAAVPAAGDLMPGQILHSVATTFKEIFC